MIDIYRKGDTVELTLEGDEKNPTIFVCEMMTDEEEATFQYLRSVAVSQVEIQSNTDHKAMQERIKISVKQNRIMLASKVKRIINAPPGGETIESQSEVASILEAIPPEQVGQLRAALSDMNKARALKFRGHAVSGTPSREGRGGEAAQEAS